MSSSRKVLARSGGSTRWLAAIVVIALITTGAGISLSAFASWLLAHTALVLTTSTASMVILAVRTSAVVRVVGRWCERWYGHRATFAVLTRIRVRIFRDLIPASPTALADRGAGDVVARIVDDVDTMQDHLLRVAVPLLVGVITIVGTALVLALLVSIPCALAALLGLAANAIAVPLVSLRAASRSSANLITLRARRDTLIVEALAATDELAVWGALDAFEERIARLDEEETSERRRLAWIESTATAVRSVVTVTTALAAMALAHFATTSAGIDSPFIVVAPLVVLAAMEVAGPMGAAVVNRARSEAAAKRLLAITSLPHRAVGPHEGTTDTGAPAIDLRSVSFTHPDGPTVLVRQDLAVERGETVMLTGASGAGKSTIADLVLRSLAPDEGSIRVLGCDVEGLTDSAAATRVTALLQPDHLFDTTVRDNLRVGADASDDAMRAVLADLDLDLTAERGDALDRRVGIDGDAISGGERQRLLIARALLSDSPVVILDEPTEHLDPARRGALFAALLRRRQGRTMLILSHDPAVEAIADRVLRIDNGMITDDRR